MELKGLKINFLGDSITEGAALPSFECNFHQIIKEKHGLSQARCYGRGGTRIARQQTPSAIPGHDLDFVQRGVDMEDDADVVVVFGGTNDYGHGDAKIGDMNSRDVNTFYGALHTLCQLLMEKYPGKKIVFMTPLHRLGDRYPSAGNGLPLSAYVDIIKEVTSYYNLPVIDLFEDAPLDPSDPNHFADGLHPNKNGHEILAEFVAKELKKIPY